MLPSPRLLSTVALLSAFAPAQAGGDPDTAWQRVAARWRALAGQQGVVGSSLAFFHRDRTYGPEVHGHADLATQRQVDADTIYHWASITKTFTAIAIMQLRDRGRLKLDDPIVDYLPELRRVRNPHGSMRAITLRHLLTHTSGFPGPTWPWKSQPWHPHEPTAWSQIVAMLPYQEIAFEPGTKVSYSNPAFIFLGRVVEQLSGDDYEVYVDKNILRPLGMYRSYFDTTPYHLLRHRSDNYRVVGGKPVGNGLDFDTGITVANGGLNAPLPDMLRYLRFLVGCADTEAARAVLKRESLEEMWRQHELKNGSPTSQGLAFFVEHAGNAFLVGHTGGQKSFNSFVYIDPAAQTGCIAAFNTSLARSRGSAFGETRKALFESMFPLFPPAPRSVGMHYLLGAALRRQGKFEGAIGHLRRATELEPDFAEAHDELGNALGHQGRFAEAMACFRKVIALRPDLHRAHDNLGVALRESGWLDEAIAQHREAIRLCPEYARAHGNLGVTLGRQGRYDTGFASLKRALELDPEDADTLCALGTITGLRGDLPTSTRYLRRALQLEAGRPMTHNNLGLALRSAGRLSEAVEHLREAVRLAPGAALFQRNLGETLQKLGRDEEAGRVLEKAAALEAASKRR